jgi:predicted ATPase/class 3 adenylate cyclase
MGSDGVRPSGTVTFLFTDVEGSTRLWDEYPDVMRVALARHDELLRKAVESFDGFVFSTGGDGLAAAFHRAADGVGAAVAAQRALTAEPWPEQVALRVRMGVHTGEAEERDGDYFGPPVNRAARIMAAGCGGQVLVSSASTEVAGSVPSVEMVDLGMLRLRGQAEAVQVFGVQADGLDAVVPLVSGAVSVAGNLPHPVTEWFGPVTQVQRGSASIAGRRLMTLTGPGGVGKTRLAIEMAWSWLDEFPDGAWLIDLAPIADPGAVAAAVATTLSVRPQEGMSTVESVVDWLRGRRLLLVVDNCEHVLGPVSELVRAIVSGVTSVTILATSREPLGVPGERVVAVPSLGPADAVSLFCNRAEAANETVRFDDANLAAVTELCARLDGIPLAIELAAARIRSLTARDLLARLDDRFRLLRGSGRGGLERHQTLRATVAWSYQLLADNERLLFDRLSVFAGGFDLRAVEAVCADDAIDVDDVFDLLDSLVDKSMITVDRSGDTARYRLLETLRQYGEEQLGDRDETAELLDRHLAHFLQVAEHTGPLLLSSRQREAQSVFGHDWDNLRAALSRAAAKGEHAVSERLVWASFPYGWVRLLQEHRRWTEMVLAADGDEWSAGPMSFGMAASWAVISDEHDLSIRLARDGIARAASPADPRTTGCWFALVNSHIFSGRRAEASEAVRDGEAAAMACDDPINKWWFLYAAAMWGPLADLQSAPALLHRALDYAEQTGSPTLRASAAQLSSALLLKPGDPSAVPSILVLLAEGLELARGVDDPMMVNDLLAMVALAHELAESPEAPEACREALAHMVDTRYWVLVGPMLKTAATTLIRCGRVDAGAALLGYIATHHPVAQLRRWAAVRAEQLRLQGADQHIARGEAMDRDTAIAYAIAELTGMQT